ncbi:ATP-binding cassette domain-containing protein [Gordonia sp. NPDC127522]|uniref:ATP-binding cassette domain-containing protein n=1 Tax=Gordonia sp. NPDC127522 TaxID=3345390 RepID=UPI0036312E74
MPEATEPVETYRPRHQRTEGGSDPFAVPDPVAEKLRQWRDERSRHGDPSSDDAEVIQQDRPGDAARIAPHLSPPRSGSDTRESAEPTTHFEATERSRFVTNPSVSPARLDGPLAGGPSPKAASALGFNGAKLPPNGSVALSTAPPTADLSAIVPGVERPASDRPVIQATNLQKRFKDTVAVEDVSFSVAPGTIVAILGPNGAGKTTTVNMLCTLLKPDSGSASVNGHDVQHEAAAVRRSIMLTGQFAALDESLTGRENLILFGRLLGLSKKAARTRADELLDTFSLVDAGSKKVGKYSGGMRRRIDIACGLVTSPKVVFLDEPTTGLDPRSRQEVWSLVETLRSSGVTILLTTQYLEEADTLSDNIVVIDKGRVIAEGTSDELKESIGAAYCEVTPSHAFDLARLRDVLADLNPRPAESTGDLHVVAVPAPGGPQTLVEVIRRTSEEGIELSDVAMRRPSLDEVFLALTDPRRDRRPSP